MSQSVRRNAAVVGTLGLLLAVTSAASPARADVQHVVARGHTLEAIAHRYHVDVKAIVAANHITDPNHLKPGDTLTIPGVKAPAGGGASASSASGADAKGGKSAGKGKAAPASQKPVSYAQHARTPGVIHAARLATGEDFTLHVEKRAHQTPATEKTAERMLRSVGGQAHAIDPRLLGLLGVVSDHFGSRKIEIISGFRPYSPTQHTAHSNHNIGHAVDFRVVGVPNEAVRDFCRTLHNTGCGYYPNSTFVHMDARSSPSYWIDYSKPGEPPRYNSPDADPDEGTSDVGDEMHSALSGPAGGINPPADTGMGLGDVAAPGAVPTGQPPVAPSAPSPLSTAAPSAPQSPSAATGAALPTPLPSPSVAPRPTAPAPAAPTANP